MDQSIWSYSVKDKAGNTSVVQAQDVCSSSRERHWSCKEFTVYVVCRGRSELRLTSSVTRMEHRHSQLQALTLCKNNDCKIYWGRCTAADCALRTPGQDSWRQFLVVSCLALDGPSSHKKSVVSHQSSLSITSTVLRIMVLTFSALQFRNYIYP